MPSVTRPAHVAARPPPPHPDKVKEIAEYTDNARTRAKRIRACHASDFPGGLQLNQTVLVLSYMVKEISKCREPAVSDTMACLLGQGYFRRK